MDWAVAGLRKLRPDDSVSLSDAVRLGQREIGIEGGKPGPGRGHKTADDVSRLAGYGNSAAYIVARLARDHPDILAAYERGEFKTPTAAARAAGIIKEKTPLQKIRALLRKLTAAECAVLCAECAVLADKLHKQDQRAA